MDQLSMDIRYSLRTLRKSPAFTLVAILVLASGIGATTAIFSVVNAVLIRPLPYKEPSRLVAISSLFQREGVSRSFATGVAQRGGALARRFAIAGIRRQLRFQRHACEYRHASNVPGRHRSGSGVSRH